MTRRKILRNAAVAAVALVLAMRTESAEEARKGRDAFGGWSQHQLKATGGFRIEKWRGGFWFVTPEGHPFVAVALAHANLPKPADGAPAAAKADRKAYEQDVLRWMGQAGFNAFSYTTPEDAATPVPWVATLGLIPGFINFGPQPFDPYDPAWRASATRQIAEAVPALKHDRRVIGVCLSYPLLVSPRMMPAHSWQRLKRAPSNYLMDLKAMGKDAPGKRAYVDWLQRTYGTFGELRRRREVAAEARDFPDLLPLNLAAHDDPFTLHPDDAAFYTQMWSDAAAFLAATFRQHDADGLVFSPRFIGLREWPDAWVAAWLKGVGPHVDAFVPEIYAADKYREIIEDIGRLTGKPAFIADGMRPREFNYAEETSDAREAAAYRAMFTSLIESPWFLGGTVCEYRTRFPSFPWYAQRADTPREGIRHADLTDRPALLGAYRSLHAQKETLRSAALERRAENPSSAHDHHPETQIP